jgi:predicted restriction endonuclease
MTTSAKRDDRNSTYSTAPARDGATDADTSGTRRLEHDKLSKWVMAQARGQCALCHRPFPDNFLITAHIKKRKWCSDTERNDMASIAMAACKLGCDVLYEAGLIGVDAAGQVIASDLLHHSAPLMDYFNANLKGKICKNWKSGSRDYFDWHLNSTFRRPVTLP